MLEIKIDDTAVLTALQNLQRQVNDMTPAMREIGEHIASEIDLCFRDAQDPYGNPWAALSDVTIAKRRNSSDKPLNDTGRLKKSITANLIGHDGVEIGTDVEYAITHQRGARQGQYGNTKRGGPIPWGDVPARPFMPENGLPDDWQDDVLGIIQRYLEAAV